jgi:uncharacterized protein YndB with AHSA1/START domain
MPANTVQFHRVLRATPERIYRAFLDADAMAKRLPPNGFTGKVHQLEASVGGTYKMCSRISRPAAATRSADATSSWCRMNGFSTRIDSTIRTYPAR